MNNHKSEPMKITPVVKRESYDELWVENKTIQHELARANELAETRLAERNRLFDEMAEEKSRLYEQIRNLIQANDELKEYKHDYIKLERDYQLERECNDQLVTQLEQLRHTEKMNLMMMERYIEMSKGLEE